VLGLTARVEALERVRPAHRDEYRALVHRATVTAGKRIETAAPDVRGRAFAASPAVPARAVVPAQPDRACWTAGFAPPPTGAGAGRPVLHGARAPPAA
jgi:hypothetical protein